MSDRVLGNLSTAILMLDENLAILFSNQAAENLLQESSEHMREKCLTSMVANGTELAAIVTTALSTDQVYTLRQLQLIVPGKNEDVTVDVTVTPILGTRQALVEFTPMDRYLRIDRDAALNEHHEITRQMVRGLAHEIKNPLGGIKGSAQLLEKELPQQSLTEYTDIIIKETDRLTSLVDRMLGPNAIPEMQPINIHVLLERICKLIELEADDTYHFKRDYDPSIPEVEVDPGLMLQALLNITRNAMQFLVNTDNPQITLTTRIDRQFTITGKRHKVVLRIDIADNGPGIDEDIREHLFYPMISGRPGGTGLGLSLAQSIISQHRGMLEFTSIPGDTVFKIYIPLEQLS
ncbi:MAG: nitrogen regulation protein NR(II) [Gammaproteobacteria bacterium]|nr:nitrogen regulation protein NR(II) [Gammaproteobacteria bacterium]MBT4493443.1 nitrogen regulation protein NR(II) [Gammaproteobacteria bacterium]MBT7371871.1 nitrogen regulation protein NR(II) [Gammaproteobacteria bacterium]